jgi:pimeloyl-ACP methyl ester carboxylesterase
MNQAEPEMKRIVLLTALVLALAGSTPAGAITGFQPVACAYDIPAALGAHAAITCGLVSAPLDPADPNGPAHLLSVVRVSAVDRPAPDPIMFLSGGPGVGLDAYWGAVLGMVEGGLLQAAGRDLILFDQRGVGYSTPSLDCEVERGAARTLPTLDVNRTCSARLGGEGIDFALYTTVHNAADVHAVRRALGYQQVNLFGHSYGSRLALAVMRYRPDGVRSVVLEGVFPPNARFIALPRYVEGALQRLFDACDADVACVAAYGDLESLFEQTYTRLKFERGAGGIDHMSLVRGIYYLLQGSRADQPSIIPAFIAAAASGDRETIVAAFELVSGEIPPRDLVSEGMQTLVNCADEAPFLSEAHLAGMNEGVRAEILDVFAPSVRHQFLEQCSNWPPVQLDPSHYEGVVSDIPTLIVNGTFDQVTALENAELAASTLTNATLIPFPGYGHWPLGRGNPCAVGIYAAFLAAPGAAVDASCVDDTPITFVLP